MFLPYASSAFVPVFSDLLEHKKRREAYQLASALAGLLLVALTAISLVFILLAPVIIPVFTGDNFTPELAATGLRAPNRVERIFDFNPGVGGPILKDRIWFYGTFRRWGVDQTVTDSFYNLDPSHRGLELLRREAGA